MHLSWAHAAENGIGISTQTSTLPLASGLRTAPPSLPCPTNVHACEQSLVSPRSSGGAWGCGSQSWLGLPILVPPALLLGASFPEGGGIAGCIRDD